LNGDGGDGGFGSGPRQITHERVGGWDEVVIAIRDTLLLGGIAAARVLFVALLSLLAGPWALVVLVPLGAERVALWLAVDDDPELWTRQALAAACVLVFVVLLVVPDAALVWWPWRWQATRASWWGVWWPAWWPRLIPALVLVRTLVVAVLLAAWREVWYLQQRLRREILVPTASGATFVAAELHAIDVPGAHNPYRGPLPEPEPERERGSNRRIPVTGKARAIGGNGTHDAPVIRKRAERPLALDVQYIETAPTYDWLPEFPVAWFVTPSRAEEWAAALLASGGRQVSANAMHPHYASEPRSREVRDWLEARSYCTRVNPRRWVLTDDGVALLRDVAAGHWREWEEAAVEA
jgi:hypothetical protein